MSTTDARGHTVPEGTDPAARQSLLDLSLSIPSVAAAASETAANRHVQALIQAGVTVDGDHPVHVYRSDLGAIMTWNGTAWAWPSGNSHTGDRLVSPAVPSGPWDAFAGRTIEVARATMTVDHPRRALIFGQVQARPTGNASGALRIEMYGDVIKSRNWHSQGSASHQWPALFCAATLKKGTTDIRLMHTTGNGSNSVSIEYGTLDVEILG